MISFCSVLCSGVIGEICGALWGVIGQAIFGMFYGGMHWLICSIL